MKTIIVTGMIGLGVALGAHADQEWEITTSMSISDMAMQIPPVTQQICVAQGQQPDEQGIKANKNCNVSNINHSGNTMSFDMNCSGKVQMTGKGRVTKDGDSAYQGSMNMTGSFGDTKTRTILIQYQSHKVADACSNAGNSAAASGGVEMGGMGGSASPFGALLQRESAMAGAAMDQQCQNQLDKWDLPSAFIGPNAYCSAQAGDYCKIVTQALKNADTNKVQAVMKMHPHWQQAGRACGIDTDSLATSVCSTAKSANDWASVASACPDAEVLAKAHCTGTDRNAINSGTYGPLCQAFPNEVQITPTLSGELQSAGSKAENVGDSLINGVDRLRSIFGH